MSERNVVTRHALRNSLITVTTLIGLEFGVLISGAVVTETVFGIPGFGRLTVDAINQRDYALIQGIVLVVAVGYVIVNLARRRRVLAASIRGSGSRRRRERRRRRAAESSRASPAPAAKALPAPADGRRGARRRARLRRGRRVRAAASLRTSPSAADFSASLAHPSWQHLLGTDDFGRDVLSRLVWGARASMQVGFLATVLAMLVAVPIGLVAGYYRGWVDAVIARSTDVLLAFPFLILAIGLAAILGPRCSTRRSRSASPRCRD